MTSTAAAPSLSGQALPAVTVPSSGLNAGLSSASFSIVVPGRGPSSRVDLGAVGRARPATISESKWPESRAATARFCEMHGPLVLRLAARRCSARRRSRRSGPSGCRRCTASPRSRRAAGGTRTAPAAREARDGLDAGGDVLVALARLDGVEGHPQRLQRGGAEAVDGRGRDVMVDARPAARRCGRRCSPARPSLEAAAHHHVDGLREVDLGVALDERLERHGGEVVGADVLAASP